MTSPVEWLSAVEGRVRTENWPTDTREMVAALRAVLEVAEAIEADVLRIDAIWGGRGERQWDRWQVAQDIRNAITKPVAPQLNPPEKG